MPITPEQLARGGTESDHQKAFFQFIAISATKRWPAAYLAHAVPNGSKLMGIGTKEGQIEGAKMKAEGLRPGVPDVFVPVPIDHYVAGERIGVWPGLWIEFKKPGREREALGGRSEQQVEWQRSLVEQGYAVVTAYGWQAGAHALSSYMEGELEMPEGGDCHFALVRDAPPW